MSYSDPRRARNIFLVEFIQFLLGHKRYVRFWTVMIEYHTFSDDRFFKLICFFKTYSEITSNSFNQIVESRNKRFHYNLLSSESISFCRYCWLSAKFNLLSFLTRSFLHTSLRNSSNSEIRLRSKWQLEIRFINFFTPNLCDSQ